MDIRSFRKFISCFIISVLFLSFLIPSIDGITYSATKVDKNAVATTKPVVPIINGTTAKLPSKEETTRAPHGRAVKGAVYHDEWNDHYRVIAAEDGGANGKGGAASDKSAAQAGNGGNYDEAGGVLHGDGGNNLKGAGTGDGAYSSGLSAEKSLSADVKSYNESVARDESIRASINASIKASQDAAYESYKASRAAAVKESLGLTQTTAPKETFAEIPGLQKNMTTVREIKEQTVVNKPTAVEKIEVVESLVPQIEEAEVSENSTKPKIENDEMKIIRETIKTFDKPIVETKAKETKREPADAIKESSIQELVKEIQREQMIEEGSGGENPEEDVDKRGEHTKEARKGEGNDEGFLKMETKNDQKGKKIFEIDNIGNLGLTDEYISISNTKTMALLASFALFIIGSIIHLFRQIDFRNKRNYF